MDLTVPPEHRHRVAEILGQLSFFGPRPHDSQGDLFTPQLDVAA